MDFQTILAALAGLHPSIPVVLSALGGLLVIGQVVVIMTPSKNDDHAWEKLHGIPILGSLLSAIALFAPIQKK